MSADFPLKSDLPIEDQLEIDRVQAIDEEKRTEQEADFLSARAIYLENEILTVTMLKGNRQPSASNAQAVLTFTDDVSDGETVTIGDEVYEFDDDSNVGAGHIAVDISGGASGNDAVNALTAAIQGNSSICSASADTGYMDVFTIINGVFGNQIALSTTCVNAEWNSSTLIGGRDAILAKQGTFYLFESDSKLFMAMQDITDLTSEGWIFVAGD